MQRSRVLFPDKKFKTVLSSHNNDIYIRSDVSNSPFTRSTNYLDRDLDSNLDCNLDRDPEVVPVYTGHSVFKTTKRITLLFIVQTLLHRNLDNIGIKVI